MKLYIYKQFYINIFSANTICKIKSDQNNMKMPMKWQVRCPEHLRSARGEGAALVVSERGEHLRVHRGHSFTLRPPNSSLYSLE